MLGFKLSSLNTTTLQQREHRVKFVEVLTLLAATLKMEVDDINIFFHIQDFIKTQDQFIDFCVVIKVNVKADLDCKALYRLFSNNSLTSSFIASIIK